MSSPSPPAGRTAWPCARMAQWLPGGTMIMDKPMFPFTSRMRSRWLPVITTISRCAPITPLLPGDCRMTVPVSVSNVVAIAAGWWHSLALRADGTVIAWGDNSYGQTNVPASATNIVAIAAGWYHNLALRADGTVIAWGKGWFGVTKCAIDPFQCGEHRRWRRL